MKKNAAVHGADQHGTRAYGGIIEMIAALRVGFRVRHHLHAAHELNQQDVNPGGRLIAIGSVVNDARDGSGLRGGAAAKSTGTRSWRNRFRSARLINNYHLKSSLNKCCPTRQNLCSAPAPCVGSTMQSEGFRCS